MTSQLPESQDHIADLLPAYVNGKLDHLMANQVHKHLLQCDACQTELSTWQTIRKTTQYAIASEPLPSTSLLDQVWAKIDALAQEAPANELLVPHAIAHLWLVFKRQVRIIHKSIWIASTLAGLFGCCLALFVSRQSPDHLHNATSILALITTVVAASGVAFSYGLDNDAGFEITLSTPTSIRTVMLCRIVLVIGYNFALSAIASAIIAFTRGGGVWEVMQLWLGPMLLLSSISLTLSLMIGSAFAVVISLIIEVLQAIPITVEKGLPALQLVRPDVWQTSPAILLLAVLLFIFAVLYAPRQPRLL
jgi:hypothetical protein